MYILCRTSGSEFTCCFQAREVQPDLLERQALRVLWDPMDRRVQQDLRATRVPRDLAGPRVSRGPTASLDYRVSTASQVRAAFLLYSGVEKKTNVLQTIATVNYYSEEYFTNMHCGTKQNWLT